MTAIEGSLVGVTQLAANLACLFDVLDFDHDLGWMIFCHVYLPSDLLVLAF